MNRTRHHAGDELAPGYLLTDYLGRGGFGEVWKATGPGGIQVAMKVIHDLDRKKGGKELRALRLLKNIRHPNLVPLTGFWLRTADGEFYSDENDFLFESHEGDAGAAGEIARGTLVPERRAAAALAAAMDDVQLIIAMGLCEHSLFDRLRQCQSEGVGGVPLGELLTYMEDAARAIDLLNGKHEIQHCDIKPQNILLLSGAAQVADFGLAKVIGDVRESSMGAGTIAYGAPEVLLGKGPSHSTDQYSLAISYFELRTGQLPFGGERISDVLNAKQHGTIDLSMLSPDEQRVIATAAAIDPDDRFPNCVEMVRALRQSNAPDLLASSLRETRRVVDATTVPLLPGKKKTPWRPAWVPVLAGLAVVALGIGAWFAWPQSSSAPSGEESAAAAQQRADGPQGAPATGEESTAVAALGADEAQGVPAAGEESAAATRLGSDGAQGVPAAGEESVEVARDAGDGARSVPAAVEESAAAARETADSTRAIAESAAATADNTRQLVEVAREMHQSLDAIRQELARAADRGGLISGPRSPSDFYHNARMYEQRGDYVNARRNYVQVLGFNLDVLDPHLQYQRVIRIQDGRNAAREVYAARPMPEQNLAAGVAVLLAEPDSSRVESLERFVTDNPEYAPAVFYLSAEYSKERLGTQGLADMEREKRLLVQFQELVDRGQLLRHFLDQTHAITMIDDARTRLAALAQFDDSVYRAPVRATAMMSSSSWSVNLAIAEVAREIHYQLNESGPFQSTGFNSYVDQRTGAPSPSPTFQLPITAERTTYRVQYTDIRGNQRGPFALVFDPAVERMRSGKQILEQLPHDWISFRNHDGRLLASFSHLVGHRYALREIRYSIDSESLDKRFPLTPTDPANPYTVKPDTPLYVALPRATQFVTVELVYLDESVSARRTFAYTPSADATEAETAAEVDNGSPNHGDSGRPVRTGPQIDVNIDPAFRRPPRLGIGF